MKKQMPTWNEKSTYEKSLLVVSLILSVPAVLFFILYLTGRWQGGMNIVQPLLGLMMFVQALQFWKYNRLVSIFSLFAAFFTLIALMIVYLY
ncbi:hypothetical protein [Clostridium aminobutyricum]|uniref:Uncharacterized protein n=1 Tax=Clostridium aminobutyricum TaxID=33953 RepID=A0A939D722_CLOAM|nr:hypothetical protein [Clostridium aminobutyricum]MBN7772305.1 hypothetical protein [Clostridium aminobutyricum]